jgi:hypothetical protein
MASGFAVDDRNRSPSLTRASLRLTSQDLSSELAGRLRLRHSTSNPGLPRVARRGDVKRSGAAPGIVLRLGACDFFWVEEARVAEDEVPPELFERVRCAVKSHPPRRAACVI